MAQKTKRPEKLTGPHHFTGITADVLTNVAADQFALELNGPLSPGVFKPVGDDRYVHVVMPVRTTS